MKSNQTAASLVDETVDPDEWNLGICATGARNSAVALDIWKRMDRTVRGMPSMWRFSKPVGRTDRLCLAISHGRCRQPPGPVAALGVDVGRAHETAAADRNDHAVAGTT
jgi:hypothetical protein